MKKNTTYLSVHFRILLPVLVLLTFLSVPAGAEYYSLQWDDNQEPDLVGYRLWYKSGSGETPFNGTGAGGGASPIDVGGVTRYTIGDLSGVSVWYFGITAYDSEGFESDLSVVVDTKAPQISNPTVTYVSDDTAVIEWTTDKPGSSEVESGTSFQYVPSTTRDAHTSTGLTPYQLTWGGTWVPNELAGLEVRADITGNSNFTIVSNTEDAINTDPADGPMTDDATAGDTFEILRTHHVVELNGLTGGTIYVFQAKSTDALGSGPDRETGDFNPSPTPYGTFTTLSFADTTPPVITAQPVVISSSDTTATIEWETDEPANGVVQFDTSNQNWGSYASSVTRTAMETDHIVTLSGLTSVYTYYFRVGSTDPSGNGPTVSAEVELNTGVSTDTTAPDITVAPSVGSITDNAATVTWTTDEPGTSVVEYGTTTAYGFTRTITTPRTTSHSVQLTGLQADTTYHFRVSSYDGAGNGPDTSGADSNPSVDDTFTTESAPDTTPPVITSSPTAGSITNSTAVIQWWTNEPSNSLVQYGSNYGVSGTSNWGEYPASASNANLVQFHQMTLTGLSGNTTYYFRVGSTDAFNNGPTTSSQVSFSTQPDPDTSVPVIIYPISVQGITNSSAMVRWTTDEASNSEVQYGTSSSAWDNYSLTRTDGGMVTSHEVTLTGLLSGTTYYFMVGSTDALNNGPATSSEFTFSTLSVADTTAPQITTPPTVTSITDETAVIQWTTDEPGNSQVRYGNAQSNWSGYPEGETVAGTRTSHTVTLTGLDSGTSYYFRAGSTDAMGNGPNTSGTDRNPSQEVSFLTSTVGDSQAPRVTSAPSVISLTDTTAVIQWITDEPGNSEVHYGPALSGTSPWGGYPYTRTDPAMDYQHTVTLTGLMSGTTYEYRIGSSDASGNGPYLNANPPNNPSAEQGFITDEDPDTTSPQVISPPTVTAKTDTTATIEWTTDEPGNSVVQYGDESAAWDSYEAIKTNAELTVNHTVTLIGLTPSSTYYLRVGSTDIVGNGPSGTGNNPSNEISFSTNAAPDTTAPLISSVEVAVVSDTQAVIAWTTDEPGNGMVQYGTGTSVWGAYPSSQNSAAFETDHTVTLINLTPSTPYFFRVGSVDASGNGPDSNPNPSNASPETTFTTTGTADVTAPQIPTVSGVTVEAVTDTTAIITWTTDEPGNSEVRYDTVDPSGAVTPWAVYPDIALRSGMATNHTVTLTGLTEYQTYYFQVGSTDAFGNGPDKSHSDDNPSGVSSFTTSGVSDVAGPVISNAQVASFSGTTATVTWTTNEPANSEVRYGTGSAAWSGYPNSRSFPGTRTAHSVTLTGLTPGTLYYCRVGSTDAFGNGPVTSSELSFTTEAPDADPPSMVEYPTVNYVGDYFQVVYDEDFMENATIEGNYAFSPTLLFDTVGGSDDIVFLGSRTYRLFMAFIPDYTTFTLTVTNITDESGNAVSPASIRINDDDGDDMADDWEDAFGLDSSVNDANGDLDGDGLTNIEEFRGGGTLALNPNNVDTDGDGMDDDWEVTYGTDPQGNDANGDLDGDGWTNLQEYNGGTLPNSVDSQPIMIREVLPPHNSGITNTAQVPINTSFAARIQAVSGIDTTTNTNIVFSIDEGGFNSYTRNLGDASVQVVNLGSDPANSVKSFWVEYQRSAESGMTPYYDYDTTVGVSVYAIDTTANALRSQTYNFKTMSVTEYQTAQSNLPSQVTQFVTPNELKVTIDDTGVTAGQLNGAYMIFNTNDGGVTPYFGPVGEIPALNYPGATGVGIPLNCLPPRVFASGITVFIPCPGKVDVSGLNVYGYDGGSWKLICYANGNLAPDGAGWLIAGWNNGSSLQAVNNGSPSGIIIWVRHFSGFIAGSAPPGGGGGTGGGTGGGGGGGGTDSTGMTGGGAGGGGGCFISTLVGF